MKTLQYNEICPVRRAQSKSLGLLVRNISRGMSRVVRPKSSARVSLESVMRESHARVSSGKVKLSLVIEVIEASCYFKV